MKSLKKKLRAYTLLEALYALSLYSVCLLLTLSLLQVFSNMKNDSISEYQVGIDQIRLRLSLAKEVNVTIEGLQASLLDSDIVLSYHNNRIVEQPGYVIYIDEVDNVSFEKRGSCIYVQFDTKSHYEAILWCE